MDTRLVTVDGQTFLVLHVDGEMVAIEAKAIESSCAYRTDFDEKIIDAFYTFENESWPRA